MGLRDRIRERAARRQAEKNAKKGTGVSTSGNIRKERSPGMSGDTGPVKKRTPQKSVTVTNKPTTVKAKTPELKKSTPGTPKKETAAQFRARKAAELEAAKDKLVAKQKAVTASKSTKTKDKKPKYTGVTNDNKKSQADIAASNKRATFNRTNKTNAKPGDTYKYKKTDGTIITIEKGGSTKYTGKGRQI